jgi:wobble nucleotide-excising tRNase
MTPPAPSSSPPSPEIRRIEWIDQGIFSTYTDAATVPDFATVNVIYGPNASGKSTLAHALDASHAERDGYIRLSLRVEDGSGVRSTQGSDDPVFRNLLVFGDDYVERNHRFHAGADMEAVLTLGERAADAERQLAELRPQVAQATLDVQRADADSAETERRLHSAYRGVASHVIGAVSAAGGRYRSGHVYTKTTVEHAFAGDRNAWSLLEDDQLAAKQSFVNTAEPGPVSTIPASVRIESHLVQRIRSCLAEVPSVAALDTLDRHPEATEWVDQGRGLHDPGDPCLYCGSTLTNERRLQIERHFSDALTRLQREISDIDSALDELASSGRVLQQEIPDGAGLYNDLRSQHNDAVALVAERADQLMIWIDQVRRRLRTKSSTPLAADNADVSEPPTIDTSDLATVCAVHNERSHKHAAHVAEAAQAVEHHHLKSTEAEVDELQAALSTLALRSAQLGELVEAKNSEISSLENVEGDPTPSAQVLTDEVAQLLGRDELTFGAQGERYQVLRDGQPATQLSTGERRAITLVHFLEVVRQFDHGRGKPIVILDDPVSSLDSDKTMGISALIWTCSIVKERVAQLILLTHSFELFRQWDIQLSGLPTRYRPESRYYEIRSRHRTIAGVPRRSPVLHALPADDRARQRLRSAYTHSFCHLAEAYVQLLDDDSLEHRLDAHLLLPNVVRRVLESFLAFKVPNQLGNLHMSMREAVPMLEAGGYPGDADVLRQRLTRYAHAYSHSDGVTTDQIVSPEEAKPALGALFEFIHRIDPGHFAGQCSVAGVEVSQLLGSEAS